MPKIYLSPSVQEGNRYVTGGSEEYYMNLVADALEPYLYANGIDFTRNQTDMRVSQIIRESNAGNYNLHLALHSNAAPENRYGQKQGLEAYYFPYSTNGKRMAVILADNFRVVYPNPSLVSIQPTTALGEVDRVRAPSVLLEIAYHDNIQDANWIINNIQTIARTIALSLTEYFGLPFVEPAAPQKGQVITTSGHLNIRSRPNTGSRILTTAPRGAWLTIYGKEPNGWYSVGYNGLTGFANGRYIRL